MKNIYFEKLQLNTYEIFKDYFYYFSQNSIHLSNIIRRVCF